VTVHLAAERREVDVSLLGVNGAPEDMSRLEQDEVGSCSFVDVLEEAVLVKRPVAIELRDGTTFIDQVTDVTTESGQDFAVFRSHTRVPVKEIAAATRAEPPRRSSPGSR
jgi:Rho-binding antiterminator